MGRAMNEWAQHVEMQITFWMSIINIDTNMNIEKRHISGPLMLGGAFKNFIDKTR